MKSLLGFPSRVVAVLRHAVYNVDDIASQTNMHTTQLQEIIDLMRGRATIGGEVQQANVPGNEPGPIQIQSLANIAFPEVDLKVANPIPAILDSPEFGIADRFFGSSPAIERSLVSVRSQALIYALIRNLRPKSVFEIGTYRAGTAEAICRALYANGAGRLHTVDPFSSLRIRTILAQWPVELRRHVRFYPLDSMAFFARRLQSADDQPSLVFVDGNHDYEYAAFDIQSAARVLAPSGFIVIDNVAQPGPFFAARDFLEDNLGWTECSYASYPYEKAEPFDHDRCGIPGTELMILRAPRGPVVGERPVGFPEAVLRGSTVRGIEIALGPGSGHGTLNAQCIARGFSPDKNPVEVASAGSAAVGAAAGGKPIKIALPVDLDPGAFEHIRAEIWLSWTGERPLTLLGRPTIY